MNPGVKRLYAKTHATTGNVTIIVLLSPLWSGVDSKLNPERKTLSSW